MTLVTFVYVVGVIVSLSTSLWLTPRLIRYALRRDLTDKPDEYRKFHTAPTPTLGGFVLICSLLAGWVCFAVSNYLFSIELMLPSTVCLLGCLIVAGVGLLDDLYHLSFKTKFLFQIALAYGMFVAGYRLDVSFISFLADDPTTSLLVSLPLTMLWIVGVINAINLIDGLDGLAAGASFIAFTSMMIAFGVLGQSVTFVVAICVVSALAGFLRYNFNPAAIFLGDSGSMLLGFLLAFYSVEGVRSVTSWHVVFIPLLALGFPMLDAGLAVVRRQIAKKAVFGPDRDHIHYRLRRVFGLSHRKTVLLLYVLCLVFGSTAVALALVPAGFRLIVLGAAALISYAFLKVLGYPSVGQLWYVIRDRFQMRAGVLPDTPDSQKSTPEPVIPVEQSGLVESQEQLVESR